MTLTRRKMLLSVATMRAVLLRPDFADSFQTAAVGDHLSAPNRETRLRHQFRRKGEEVLHREVLVEL